MNRRMLAGIIIVVVVVLGGAAYMLTRPKAATPVTTSNAPKSTETPSSASDTAAAGVTVVYDGTNFSPAKVTLLAGQKLTITNNSSAVIQPSSNPHPGHTDNPELNIGTIAAGQSKTVTLKKVGTWGYHDHFNDEMAGSVVVQ